MINSNPYCTWEGGGLWTTCILFSWDGQDLPGDTPGNILHGCSREEGTPVHKQPLKDSLDDKVIVLLEDILEDGSGSILYGGRGCCVDDQGMGVMPDKDIEFTPARGKEYPGMLACGSPQRFRRSQPPRSSPRKFSEDSGHVDSRGRLTCTPGGPWTVHWIRVNTTCMSTSSMVNSSPYFTWDGVLCGGRTSCSHG